MCMSHGIEDSFQVYSWKRTWLNEIYLCWLHSGMVCLLCSRWVSAYLAIPMFQLKSIHVVYPPKKTSKYDFFHQQFFQLIIFF